MFGGVIFYATTMLPPTDGARALFGVGVLLSLFFGPRFLAGFKIMPGGLMTGLR